MTSRTEYCAQTPNKSSLFDVQYLRNHRTLDIGVLGYIGVVWPKEHSPEVRSFPPGTTCIYIYIHKQTYIYINTYVHICVYIHIFVHVHTCIYIYAYIRTYIHTCIYIHTHTHLHTHSRYRREKGLSFCLGVHLVFTPSVQTYIQVLLSNKYRLSLPCGRSVGKESCVNTINEPTGSGSS